MGFYIETGSPTGKAEWLKKHAGGIYLTGRPDEVGNEYVPVCVVDNGQFEAAGIAFDKDEAKAFDDKKGKRRRGWLLIKREDAIRLSPKVKEHIKW